VAAQDPAPGSTAKRHSAVKLRVSGGVNVPDVAGRQVGDARAALQRFNVSTDTVESEQPEGEVLAQTPVAGTRAAAQSRVTLRVSDGSIVAVPPLHGMTLAQARTELLRAGDLSAAVSARDDRAGAIVDTSVPPAGERVKRGSTIALTLVPVTPWWAWAAGAAALLAAGGVGLSRMLRRKPPRPVAARVAVQFRPAIEFNSRPIAARAAGPAGPEIGLRGELVRGRVDVRHQEEVV
jgi:hypothetical protein